MTVLLIHAVWATRGRQPCIEPTLDEPLERMLRHKALELGVALHAFGGAPDHVHVVMQIPADVSVATLVGRLKGASSHALRQQLVSGWQTGYWAESVSQEQMPRLCAYVRSQRSCHAAFVSHESRQVVLHELDGARR